jgi:beta-galactosidase
MADHFAQNPFVVGWQTDNEFHCHFSECHCESCQQAFREFLQQKYEDIDALNQAWGTAFWAQTYRSFDAIITPRPLKPTHVNPSQQLDYYRYLSWAVTNFQHEQVQLLRQANPAWFVYHNGLFGHIDYHGQFTQDLDLLGYDIYPLFCHDAGDRPRKQAFNLDRARAWSGNFLIPEHQSGPGGQAPYLLDHPEPGEVRRMTYTSVARGADSVLYFRWRTCRFGAEEYWCGILDHDNVLRRRYAEIAQIGNEFSNFGHEVLGTHVRTDVAVAMADYDNIEAHRTMPLGLPAPEKIAEDVHAAFFQQGYAVGCGHPADDLGDLQLYIIPHWVIIDPAWIPNLEAFVRSGGVLVIGARTGTRDKNNHVIADTPPGLLRELCGVTVEEYGRQNDAAHRPLVFSLDAGSSVQTDLWYEVLQPDDAGVAGTWESRYLQGKPAVTCRSVGEGAVFYVGTYLTKTVLEALMPQWIQWSGVQPSWPDTPEDVSVVVRQNEDKTLWFFINNTDDDATLPTTPEGENLFTHIETGGAALTLEENGVVVIRQ